MTIEEALVEAHWAPVRVQFDLAIQSVFHQINEHIACELRTKRQIAEINAEMDKQNEIFKKRLELGTAL